ncbi:alpha-L-fucosidase [Halosquirtibacter xylanolyticus]|uniref:alpha-L-fucosidase n=1 Tax=Halosquirtibacter xylanolyticus TaxID=3374599 RepID=UPI003747CF1A|nr:alpha-L-fucosidase [Prolixibacteraceae bacterium]
MSKRDLLWIICMVCFISINSYAQEEFPHYSKGRTHVDTSQVSATKWKALKRDVPAWFNDAKFGIYAHWGPYCVPIYTTHYTGSGNSWYSRWIYTKGHPYNINQINKYGPLQSFGYKDFFQMFSAPRFNANEWAEIVAASGAKFAGPVAMHHDGFAMWDSDVAPWNAADYGPKRDICGELIEAYRGKGLKVVSSFHHGYTFSGLYYGRSKNIEPNTDIYDPKYAKLYGNFKDQRDAEAYWLALLKEYIVKYKPDQLWFDWGQRWISWETRYQLAKFYYETLERAGMKGIISMKANQWPIEVSLRDFERGGAKQIESRPWQTDDSPGPWMCKEQMVFKGADWIKTLLVDVVSKNGTLLLNITPHPLGYILEDQASSLREVGQWLNINGEAIYGSRPWKVYYQGPNSRFTLKIKKGQHLPKGVEVYANSGHTYYIKLQSNDFRFTRSKDGGSLYVFAMNRPSDFAIASLHSKDLKRHSTISLLGSDKRVSVEFNKEKQAYVKLDTFSKEMEKLSAPYVFKIEGLKR